MTGTATRTDAVSSFRDPGGGLVIAGDRVIRMIFPAGVCAVTEFLRSSFTATLVEQGRMIETRVLEAAELATVPGGAPSRSDVEIVLEHPMIFFPSYPTEWPPEMLCAAAGLTLDLAVGYRGEGLGLKDATPCNIMFEGPRPKFLDILSVEHRDVGDPLWKAQAQFERTFLLPLLAWKFFRILPAQIFSTFRDGIEPETLYPLCGPLRRLFPPFLGLVTLPTLLRSKTPVAKNDLYAGKLLDNPEKAGFILDHAYGRLRRQLESLAPAGVLGRSAWVDYEANNSYDAAGAGAKQSFVEKMLSDHSPRTVLDIGCNTGQFSRLAARSGARVVAIDSDPVVVGRLWENARIDGLDILPLVVDLARPTPATGWRNQETLSFINRATGRFDAVLMLAVLHHLIVTERIPLRDLMKLVSELTTNLLLIEFVGKEDPMFRALCRGRQELYDWFTRDVFENALAEFFTVIEVASAGDMQRCLYLVKKR